MRAVNAEVARSSDVSQRAMEDGPRTEPEGERWLGGGGETTRVLDELVGTISHELRTPLNSILAWAQILAAAPPSPETVSRATASLVRNVHAQTRMIDDLIDASRLLLGTLELKMEAVDLRSAVQAAWDAAAPAGRAKRLNLTLQTPKTPTIVQGDKDRLQQMVGNLLANAVAFTAEGGSVFALLAETGGGYSIRVADTGIGIEPELLPHAFGRLRHADRALTRRAGGLRLGLAIVEELTELHGGTVRAESDGPALGATFTITLPAVRRHSPGGSQPDTEPDGRRRRRRP